MDKVVSASEANRRFSDLLRRVREGRSFVVTSHGKPVARLVPVSSKQEPMTRARRALLKRLERQPVANAGGWTRADLYERDE